MPLCKFPEVARYTGSGDLNAAANWTCRPDDRSLLRIRLDGIQAGEAAPLSVYPHVFGQDWR